MMYFFESYRLIDYAGFISTVMWCVVGKEWQLPISIHVEICTLRLTEITLIVTYKKQQHTMLPISNVKVIQQHQQKKTSGTLHYC